MIDLLGTPYTKALHMVERYRLRDYDDVKDVTMHDRRQLYLVVCGRDALPQSSLCQRHGFAEL